VANAINKMNANTSRCKKRARVRAVGLAQNLIINSSESTFCRSWEFYPNSSTTFPLLSCLYRQTHRHSQNIPYRCRW